MWHVRKNFAKKATNPSLAALRIALSFSSHVPGFPFSPVFLETDVDVDSAEPRLSAAWACPSLAERSLSCEMAYDRDLSTSQLSAANYVLAGGPRTEMSGLWLSVLTQYLFHSELSSCVSRLLLKMEMSSW